MIIAFSGIDGSGKTTYAKSVVDYLQGKKLKAKYTHSIRNSFYHLILHNIVGKISRSSKESMEAALRNKKNRIYFPIAKFIKNTLLLINLVYFNIRYGRYKGVRRNTIVCDRYFYDDLVQMRYLESAGDKFLDFYENLIIKPDITFFIKGDPVISYGRKREYDKDYFIKKSDIYSKMYKTITNVEIPEGSLEAGKNIININVDAALSSI